MVLWRVLFWPLHCDKSVETFFSSNRCNWNLELFEALIANSVLVYVTLTLFAQLKKVLGWARNRTSKEAPSCTCWGSSFGPPCKGNVFNKGSESGGPPWNQKWSTLEGPVVPSLCQICWNVYFKLKPISPATAATGILNWGGPFLCACFLLRFEDQKRPPSFFVILFCSNFHSLEALEACLKACLVACPEMFCSNFHGLTTLEFETCVEACL